MSEEFKKMSQLRIRGRVYQLDIGEMKGFWTYYLLLGESDNPNECATYHADMAYELKADAVSQMQKHAESGYGYLEELLPKGMILDQKTGKPVKTWGMD